ncbi:GNAT family N-acetyltransferase [Tessaracoccus flavescens]|uniref:N-acetyltransferase domain-containing protein n=1 Tax=Tessaracoccus flavescens TaxID=399497 RepID=A0A1Q2D1A4_9ACTN|nr:GNAT family N-acetyltransferase [Tessaracoccus flavescens]AQP52132.1 hypothetical protein BW733_16205 [Tessaracoccus flavescens]
MEAYVEPHLRWRLLGQEDVAEVENFRSQLEALDNSVLSGMASAIMDTDLLPADGMAVGGWDAYDSLSAFGVSFIASTDPLRIYVMGGVHPVHRHMLVGTSLLRWQVERARHWRDANHPDQPMWLGCYAEIGRPGLERVALKLGFTAERYYYDLHRDLSRPLAVPRSPGIDVAGFRAEDSEAVRVLHNLCFQAIGGSEVLREVWDARLADPAFRPDWSFIARDGDRIIGYAMSAVDGEENGGWTERFGVHPDYRRRGILLALLGHCLHAMRASGCTEAGIGIDTPDGLGLSRLAGELDYTTRDAVALLSRVV